MSIPISIVIGLFALCIGWGIWQRLRKRGYYWEIAWSIFILAIGTSLCIGLILRLPIPNPLIWIEQIFAPVYKPIQYWLEEG